MPFEFFQPNPEDLNKENPEVSGQEDMDEAAFQRYVEDLRLQPEDFDKKILDVGAGAGRFAKWAKEHNVSSEIYSLEPARERLENHTNAVQGFAEAIPFNSNSFELVVSEGAIPNIYGLENDAFTTKEKIESSFNEMIRVLKPGGEIRLARVIISEYDEPHKNLAEGINEALNKIRERNNCEIEMEHVPVDDIYENEKQKTGLLAKSYLIIIRKPENTKQ